MQEEAIDIRAGEADILEDDILRASPELLDHLLRDHTTGQNIFWATHDYESLGEGYEYSSPILPELITGPHGRIIMPRVMKAKQVQTQRKRDKAEIFTPAWVCNSQVNLIDSAWFGREGAFNTENADHTWLTTEEPITFPQGKTWRDYVRDNRLEITCGEAPYIASRYDASTGQPIPLGHRIGMLDRKLRVVGENTQTTGQWLQWAHEALKSVYGYEWQGDSLLLARENVLLTFIEHYREKFQASPMLKSVSYAAYIISWNLWQMDGLKGVVPETCGEKPDSQLSLFDEPRMVACEGCRTGDIRHHNGTYCLLRDWAAKPLKPGEGPGRKIRFIDLMKKP